MQCFVLAEPGPMPPRRVVRLLAYEPGRTLAEAIDQQGRPVNGPFWLEGRPVGWRFPNPASAFHYVETRQAAAEARGLINRVVR